MSAPRPLSSLGDLYSWLSLGRRGPVTPRGSPSTSTSRPGRQQPPDTPLCEKSPDHAVRHFVAISQPGFDGQRAILFPPFSLNPIHFPLSFLIFFFFFFSSIFRSSDRISNKSFTCYSIVLKSYERIINRKFEFSPLPG